MPAFTINIPIRNIDANDVKDAFAHAYGYTEIVQIGGVNVPNPITKEEFVKQKCINFMLEITRGYLIKKEEVVAVESAKNSVNVRSQEVVGWFDNRRIESVGGMDAFTRFPVVDELNLTTNKNEPVSFTLTGTDPDNLPLSFTITSPPINGSVLGQNPNLIYVPSNRFIGNDSFKVKANNGTKNSLESVVNVTVNRTLTTSDNFYTLRKNQSLEIPLIAYDNVGAVSFTIIDSVDNGTITGTNVVSYVPDTNFLGLDSFTFQAQDDTLTSNIGTVTIEVNNITVECHTFDVNKDTSISFVPQALNGVGIPDFEIAVHPVNGILSINNGEYTYTPNQNFVGTDSFGLIATDIYGQSEIGTYSVNVNQI